MYNGTEYAMVVNGLSKQTLLNDRQSVTVTGVNSVTGADFNQTYNAGQTYTIGTTTIAGDVFDSTVLVKLLQLNFHEFYYFCKLAETTFSVINL